MAKASAWSKLKLRRRTAVTQRRPNELDVLSGLIFCWPKVWAPILCNREQNYLGTCIYLFAVCGGMCGWRRGAERRRAVAAIGHRAIVADDAWSPPGAWKCAAPRHIAILESSDSDPVASRLLLLMSMPLYLLVCKTNLHCNLL
jgi:hypothetical protein